ncbi:MAG TPA: NCS2 family permease [Tessaracoccus flavescens]|uniref:NCS2 family permease n=1 Tax=Tessaracoccus flavescens TaxID=399497 RepID=A0A921JQ03_9ACTN|nr:NCS2 family permease [Tessaracoccus flavescens]
MTKRGSSVGQELRGGLVTFFAMAYIIALNPLIIGTATDKDGNLISGAPKFTDAAMTVVDGAAVGASIGMVAAATALVAGLLTLAMGIIGRFPMGLAAGLGLNALVAYVLAPQMTWPQAMGLVVWEGILIFILVLTGFRTAVFKAIPKTLRTAISVGIGLFIAFVGLVNAGVVRKGAGTPVELGVGGSLQGWPIAIFFIGISLLIALYVLKVKGAMLISIVVATVIAIIVEAVKGLGGQAPDGSNPLGWSLNVPALQNFTLPDLGLIGRVDMVGAFFPDGNFSITRFIALAVLVFSLLLADFFDTMGTVVAVGSEGKLLDEHGMPERTTEILLVDSVAAAAGGLGSVSSNTCYIESTAGVGEGARTGLASVFTGLAFLLAIFLSPLINMVPSEAAAPVLVFVGFLMISQVVDVDWENPEVGIPAFLTMILMPFAYSITTGIGAGFLAYVFIKVVKGKAKEVHPLMYVVAALFVIYFVQGALLNLIGS